MAPIKTVLALDVGDVRIGVASASLVARLPSTQGFIEQTEEVVKAVQDRVKQQNAIAVVVGWPRSLSGQPTAQTKKVEEFAAQLKKALRVPVYLQDEALTSKQAEAELSSQKGLYNKGAIDALAATYILGDFLAEHTELTE